ncbi:MAG TPA: hypothetical protein DHV36_04935 [Desulfobacteraceae bacterium]|nr:hypothetical protein [Desulfobacteraceae bacterium]
MIRLVYILFFLCALPVARGAETEVADLTGRDIVTQAVLRHAGFPYVYEEQTMVLRDDAGNKNVRKLRQYFRIEADRTIRILMIFDYPREVRGLALYSVLKPDGQMEKRLFMPALKKTLISGAEGDGHVLGTDFTITDFIEPLDRTVYKRQPDQTIEKVDYYVVDAYDATASDPQSGESIDGRPHRRHFVRKDILFIVRTDYFDGAGRLTRQYSRHEIRNTDRDLWLANMLLMENRQLEHTTLIKVDRRVLSEELVRPEVFTLPESKSNTAARAKDAPAGAAGKNQEN